MLQELMSSSPQQVALFLYPLGVLGFICAPHIHILDYTKIYITQLTVVFVVVFWRFPTVQKTMAILTLEMQLSLRQV